MPGAPSPDLVTHAITLKGAQLTWAILHGHKTIENRSTRISPGWYALHTGLGKTTAEYQAGLKVKCAALPREASLAHGVVEGALRIDYACSVEACAGTPSEPWASGPVPNAIGAVLAAIQTMLCAAFGKFSGGEAK